jgi:hypothetical protein
MDQCHDPHIVQISHHRVFGVGIYKIYLCQKNPTFSSSATLNEHKCSGSHSRNASMNVARNSVLDEIFTLLICYTALLPTFQDNILVPSSTV